MDLLWIIVGIILMVVGIIGCILPFLPGPPLCFLALLVQQLRSDAPYSFYFLLVWALIALGITVIDYAIPIYGTRKFGGSKYGMWGSTIGLLIGLWFGPVGIIIGPFIGAFIGEWLAHNQTDKAFQAALGSFIGFLFGTLLKLVVCAVMAWYLFVNL